MRQESITAGQGDAAEESHRWRVAGKYKDRGHGSKKNAAPIDIGAAYTY